MIVCAISRIVWHECNASRSSMWVHLLIAWLPHREEDVKKHMCCIQMSRIIWIL